MKTKIFVIVLLIFVVNNVSYAQKTINLDTTMFYVNNLKKECVDAIEYCSKEFKEFDEKNKIKSSVVLVKSYAMATANEDFELYVSQMCFKNDIVNNIPDFYTYINGIPIFFITGKSILIQKDSSQIKNVINFFSRFIPDDNLANLFPTNNTSKMQGMIINERNIPDNLKTLNAEEMRSLKTSPVTSTGNSRLLYSPSFKIIKSNNEIKIEKVETVIY